MIWREMGLIKVTWYNSCCLRVERAVHNMRTLISPSALARVAQRQVNANEQQYGLRSRSGAGHVKSRADSGQHD